MKKEEKEALYESIMLNISKYLKNILNEDLNETGSERIIEHPDYGKCVIRYAFDADTETGDFYDVFCIEDGNEKFLCAIPYNIDIDDDDTVIKEIDDAIDWVEYKDENDMYSQDDDLEDFDNFEDDDLDESYEDDDLEDEPKYSLIGCDGNAYAVMGYVTNCMKKEGKTREEIKAYQEQAMSGDYDNLLAVSCEILDELNEK